MGQAMPQQVREQLSRHPDVLTLTNTHIILRDGRVFDPSEFPIQEETVYLVMKLVTCVCNPPHQIGKHLIIQATQQRFALGGGRLINMEGTNGYCRHGGWTCEEVLSDKQARELGILHVVQAQNRPPVSGPSAATYQNALGLNRTPFCQS